MATSSPPASAAAELRRVGIVEALELLLLIGEQEPGKFDQGGRWQARYCRQMPDVDAR